MEYGIFGKLRDRPDAVYRETAIADPEGEEDDDSLWLVEQKTEESVVIHHSAEGPAKPGMYLVIRVQGLAQVKVDASVAAIDVGMPLIAGDKGVAIDADAALRRNVAENALIIGQAMEPLTEGSGLIWVLVSPR